jgi:hypothetical protein
MYIRDYKRPIAEPSLLYTKRTPGLVVKNNEETGKDVVLGVYIPRLMFGLPIKDGVYEKSVSINTSKIKNSKNKRIGNTTLTVKNYMELPVSINPNINPPKYVNGENVIIDFADDDLKSMYILPYSFGDIDRRKTDILTIYVNNFKEAEEKLSLNNIYGIQLDSKNQLVSIFTSQNNDEKGVYTFAIDAKNGAVLISDSGKRMIKMSTETDAITAVNEAKSEITMAEDAIIMRAKSLTIEMESEIIVKTEKMTREIETIETTAAKDEEHIDALTIDGNDYKRDYNKQEINGSSYEHATSKFKVDSPVSGFTKVLTADSFSISPNAGTTPPPTAATINSAGVAKFGNPSSSAMPLAIAIPTVNALTAIASVVDSLGASHGVPPTLSAVISSAASNISSRSAHG